MTSIIIVSVNQFQIIIVLILSTLNGNWFSDCMFEFILGIVEKCSLVPLKALVLASLVGQVPVKSRCLRFFKKKSGSIFKKSLMNRFRTGRRVARS